MFWHPFWIAFRTEVETEYLVSRVLYFVQGNPTGPCLSIYPLFCIVNFSFIGDYTLWWDRGRVKVGPSALVEKAIHLARSTYNHSAIFTLCWPLTYKWQALRVHPLHYAFPSVLSEFHFSTPLLQLLKSLNKLQSVCDMSVFLLNLPLRWLDVPLHPVPTTFRNPHCHLPTSPIHLLFSLHWFSWGVHQVFLHQI